MLGSGTGGIVLMLSGPLGTPFARIRRSCGALQVRLRTASKALGFTLTHFINDNQLITVLNIAVQSPRAFALSDGLLCASCFSFWMVLSLPWFSCRNSPVMSSQARGGDHTRKTTQTK